MDSKWIVYIDGKTFHPLHVPRSGKAKIQVKVGGELKYSGDFAVQDYTLRLNR